MNCSVNVGMLDRHFFKLLQRGASSRWSLSLYHLIRHSEVTKKTHPFKGPFVLEHSKLHCANPYCDHFLYKVVQNCTNRTNCMITKIFFCWISRFSKLSRKFKKICKLSYAKCCTLSNCKKCVISSVLATCSLLSF